MTNRTNRSPAAIRGADGFTLIELITVVAVIGILCALAAPSMVRMLQRQETKTSATEMAGLLSDARSRAVSEGTPHLVYFNPPSVDADGNCGAAAVEVRDADHSYSITDGDDSHEFRLPSSACRNVAPVGERTAADPSASETATLPMPQEDLAVRAPDASAVGAVTKTVASVVGNTASAGAGSVGAAASTVAAVAGGTPAPSSDGSGSEDGGSDSSGKGSGKAVTVADANSAVVRSSTVQETAVNGATFPVDPVSGRAVVAFSEHGIPVDPADPNAWGSGAGGIYLTDGTSTFAALVAPLGDVKLRAFDAGSQTWK